MPKKSATPKIAAKNKSATAASAVLSHVNFPVVGLGARRCHPVRPVRAGRPAARQDHHHPRRGPRAGAAPDPGRDLFSICEGAKTPLNQLVITGGVIEQCTQAQAEDYLNNRHKTFKSWRTGIFEGDGAGEQFFMFFVQRNRGAKWRMEKTGGKSKRYRQEQEMGPWLENGTVLISDADDPYLNALRKALADFPDGNNDVRDGLYWLCRAFPEVLVLPQPKPGEGLPKPEQRQQAGLQSAWSNL